jgi:hypothetical protein
MRVSRAAARALSGYPRLQSRAGGSMLTVAAMSATWTNESGSAMTFDQWVDAVDEQLRRRLGPAVRTEEISWDSATWIAESETVVASLADDERTATIAFDAGDKLAFDLSRPEARPEIVSGAIAGRLGARSA